MMPNMISDDDLRTKPGIRSSEFYFTLGYGILTFLVAMFKPEMLEHWEAFVGGALAVMGYSISRGVAKANNGG